MAPPKNKRIIKMNAISFGKLVAAMLDGTMTIQDLADHTGLHYLTVCQYTRELHRQGASHIATWDKDSRGRDAVVIYQIGVGRDAKRYKMTAADRAARYRARKNAAALLNRMVGVPACT